MKCHPARPAQYVNGSQVQSGQCHPRISATDTVIDDIKLPAKIAKNILLLIWCYYNILRDHTINTMNTARPLDRS